MPNLPLLAVLFVGLFGVLLASFPERNSDIWKHLVAGREIVSRPGEIGPAWIFDLTTYAVYSTFGGGVNDSGGTSNSRFIAKRYCSITESLP